MKTKLVTRLLSSNPFGDEKYSDEDISVFSSKSKKSKSKKGKDDKKAKTEGKKKRVTITGGSLSDVLNMAGKSKMSSSQSVVDKRHTKSTKRRTTLQAGSLVDVLKMANKESKKTSKKKRASITGPSLSDVLKASEKPSRKTSSSCSLADDRHTKSTKSKRVSLHSTSLSEVLKLAQISEDLLEHEEEEIKPKSFRHENPQRRAPRRRASLTTGELREVLQLSEKPAAPPSIIPNFYIPERRDSISDDEQSIFSLPCQRNTIQSTLMESCSQILMDEEDFESSFVDMLDGGSKLKKEKDDVKDVKKKNDAKADSKKNDAKVDRKKNDAKVDRKKKDEKANRKKKKEVRIDFEDSESEESFDEGDLEIMSAFAINDESKKEVKRTNSQSKKKSNRGVKLEDSEYKAPSKPKSARAGTNYSDKTLSDAVDAVVNKRDEDGRKRRPRPRRRASIGTPMEYKDLGNFLEDSSKSSKKDKRASSNASKSSKKSSGSKRSSSSRAKSSRSLAGK